jgi:hypothetical protein
MIVILWMKHAIATTSSEIKPVGKYTIIYLKYSARTSQETYWVSVTDKIIFKEIIAIYSRIKNPVNTLNGENWGYS